MSLLVVSSLGFDLKLPFWPTFRIIVILPPIMLVNTSSECVLLAPLNVPPQTLRDAYLNKGEISVLVGGSVTSLEAGPRTRW